MTWEQRRAREPDHTRRLSTLAEVANAAVFVSSDEASGLTGTTVNLAMGSLDD